MEHSKSYIRNKAAKVGDTINCPSCGNEFVKSQHQQAFCRKRGKTVCKDAYWNRADPSKRNNTTRISPASQAWMDKQSIYRSSRDCIEDTFHPLDSYSLGLDE